MFPRPASRGPPKACRRARLRAPEAPHSRGRPASSGRGRARNGPLGWSACWRQRTPARSRGRVSRPTACSRRVCASCRRSASSDWRRRSPRSGRNSPRDRCCAGSPIRPACAPAGPRWSSGSRQPCRCPLRARGRARASPGRDRPTTSRSWRRPHKARPARAAAGEAQPRSGPWWRSRKYRSAGSAWWRAGGRPWSFLWRPCR